MPIQQDSSGARSRLNNECPYVRVSERPFLELKKHTHLHPDGNRLITTWFNKAWQQRNNEDATFESFIFAWMSVNAWAACVTGQDKDHEYLRRLKEDKGLRELFKRIIDEHSTVRRDAEEFVSLLPIFKAQRLRRRNIRAESGLSRTDLIQRYIASGVTEFEPGCAEFHRARGEPIPCDWPHIIAAIYRVRCNLFHGEKAAHSEMDQLIVRSAFLTLTGFFRAANIL